MEKIYHVFDRIFKRIFALSDTAIISLINGVFETVHPLDSTVVYTNRESTSAALRHRFADVFITINGCHHYHLEAQMAVDQSIIIRVFEYGFYHAMESRDNDYSLTFPEPVVIYLENYCDVPAESVIHIVFSGQGSFDYHVKNFSYLSHSLQELNQKKLIVLIPFQMLRIRKLLYDEHGILKYPSKDEFEELKSIINSDILNSIETNKIAGNITIDDVNQLIELTNQLYEQIMIHYQEKGGDEAMKPLLPGAWELPNDKYRFRIDELEKENSILTDRNSALTAEIASLKTRIMELERNAK